jgi:peptidoglycan/LPS O-acetylase OafA/YrhL
MDQKHLPSFVIGHRMECLKVKMSSAIESLRPAVRATVAFLALALSSVAGWATGDLPLWARAMICAATFLVVFCTLTALFGSRISK